MWLFFRTAKLFLHQSKKKFNVSRWSWIQATEKRFESLDFYVVSLPANFAQIIFSLNSQDFSNWLGLWHMYYVFYRLIYQQLTLESWFTNLEQMPPSNSLSTVSSTMHTNDLLTDSSKTYYKIMTGQPTIWLTTNDCLTVTKDGSKRTNDFTSLHIGLQ